MSFRTFVRTLTVLLLMLALNGCGGGSGSGFNANESWGIQIEVLPQQNLPLNLLGRDPCRDITCFHTVQINVKVTDHQGNPAPQGTEVSLQMDSGHGYITTWDDPETEDINEFTGRDNEGNIVARMGRATDSTSGGQAVFFFTSGANPGEVRLTASATAPTAPAVREKTTTLDVGGNSGLPTQVLILGSSNVIYTQDVNNVPKQTRLEVLVLDEKDFGVDDPVVDGVRVNNVLVEILDGPDAGEYLIGTNANDDRMGGQALLLSTRHGKAEFTVVSGNEPGRVLLRVTVDGADNEVDDVIHQPVVSEERIVVTSTGLNPTLQILTTELPDGNYGDSYAAQLQASQGVPPYSWTIIGELPPGVALNPVTGAIQGSNTFVPGNYCFIVRVTDSTTPEPEQTSRAFCINIDGERPPSPLRIQQSTFNQPPACAGESYAQTLGAEDGTKPYQWTLDYTPPEGATNWLELSGSGVLFGTPVDPDDIGIFNLGITVRDDGNQEDIGTIQLEVQDCS